MSLHVEPAHQGRAFTVPPHRMSRGGAGSQGAGRPVSREVERWLAEGSGPGGPEPHPGSRRSGWRRAAQLDVPEAEDHERGRPMRWEPGRSRRTDTAQERTASPNGARGGAPALPRSVRPATLRPDTSAVPATLCPSHPASRKATRAQAGGGYAGSGASAVNLPAPPPERKRSASVGRRRTSCGKRNAPRFAARPGPGG